MEALEKTIEIEVTAGGKGKVVVGGIDVSHKVNKIELTAQAGEITEVVLTMRACAVRVIGSSWVSHKMLTIDPDETE